MHPGTPVCEECQRLLQAVGAAVKAHLLAAEALNDLAGRYYHPEFPGRRKEARQSLRKLRLAWAAHNVHAKQHGC